MQKFLYAFLLMAFVMVLGTPPAMARRVTTTANLASKIVGHTYTKHRARISDRDLAEAYDNGEFRLVIDISVSFISEDEMEVSLRVDLESDFYSDAELERVLAPLRNKMQDEWTENYSVRNGFIYTESQKEPVAAINKNGNSITIKGWPPFDGNVLTLDD